MYYRHDMLIIQKQRYRYHGKQEFKFEYFSNNRDVSLNASTEEEKTNHLIICNVVRPIICIISIHFPMHNRFFFDDIEEVVH